MAGEPVHYEISAKDPDRAVRFWNGVFGWEFGSSVMPDFDYRMAQVSGSSGAAIMPGEEIGHPNVYLSTDDIDATIAKIKELGGSADDKMPVPSQGWFAACKDSEGNTFHIWQNDPSASV
jgi:predicted enzyme related to lactoylglutathione lyase